jgi:glycosyltransferase involved in cell wall biosynthesis
MERLQIALRSLPALQKTPRIIYDAEAVQGTREILKFEVSHNMILSEEEIESVLSNEIILARDADQILTASSLEATTFVDFGFTNPTIVSYGVVPQPTTTPFHERSQLLTVGPMLERDSPNSDAVCWFMQSILPHLISLLQTSKIALHCVGDCQVQEIDSLQGRHLQLLGQIRDMQPVYSHYRVMVAPTRFSAGIPVKVIEAAAYGVPCVVTPAIARQLDWRDEHELLVGHDAIDFAAKCAALYRNEELWERIRSAALERVREQFSIPEFKNNLSTMVMHPDQAVTARDH